MDPTGRTPGQQVSSAAIDVLREIVSEQRDALLNTKNAWTPSVQLLNDYLKAYDKKLQEEKEKLQDSSSRTSRSTREINVLERPQTPLESQGIDWDGSVTNDNDEEEPSSQRIEQFTQLPYNGEDFPDDSDALNESTEEDTSDDDDDGGMEEHVFTLQGGGPLATMVLTLQRRYEEVFPTIQGRRLLDPHKFEKFIIQLRQAYWKHPLRQVTYSADQFVKEQIPLGTIFCPDGGYMVPDGTVVSPEMRRRVRTVGQRYKEVQILQKAYQDEVIEFSDLRDRINEQARWWNLPQNITYQQLPVWRGMILGHIRTTIRGEIQTHMTQGKVVIKPREGPLNWEIVLENSHSPTYFDRNMAPSKNE